MSTQYYDLPCEMDLSVYQDTAQAVAHSIASVQGVRAVYRLGTAWQPGVSDIDLLVVCEEGKYPHLPSPWAISPKAKFLFSHRYLTLGERAAEQFYALFPKETASLDLLAGTEISFVHPREQLSDGEYRIMLAGVFFDILITKLASLACSVGLKSRVAVRPEIGRLYSLKYSARLLNEIRGDYELDNDFRMNVESLRNEWFKRPERSNIALLEAAQLDASHVIADMIKRFAEWSAQFSSSRPQRFLNARYEVCFTHEWSAEALKDAFKRKHTDISIRGRAIMHDVILLPDDLSVYFSWYAGESGPFSTRIRRSLDAGEHERMVPPVGFERHAQALNIAFADFERSAGRHKIPYSFGYASESGWREEIKLLIIRALVATK